MGFWSWLLGREVPVSEKISKKGFRRDDLRSAAMENLWPMPLHTRLFPVSEQTLVVSEKWVADKRAWVATLSDHDIKEAYERWLQHVELGIAENREENRTHAYRKASDARWKEMQQKSANGRSVAKVISAPPKY